MDKLNLAFEFVGTTLASLTELLFMFLALAIVGQLLFAQPIFGTVSYTHLPLPPTPYV